MDEAFRGLALDKIVTEELAGIDIEKPSRSCCCGWDEPPNEPKQQGLQVNQTLTI